MPSQNKISSVTNKDINAIDQLVNSAYRGESSKKGWTTEADLLDGLRTNPDALKQLIQDPDAVLLKYTDGDDTVMGCVYLKKKGTKLYLGMLTVNPVLQAKGIGKQLLLAAETYARQHNCNGITMTVIAIRHELIAWYERHGYRPTGETEPFPADPVFGLPKQALYFIVMEKTITGSSMELN
ncbi:MAG: GNAT family N-acetyltransferase [Sediminibacterium sp.]|nr:GNAT family N-acetyltransferase [Sediminibacterium sp.]MDP3128397.1 GNAT family N-acetyltransferase [Sediminibacterium sp.]